MRKISLRAWRVDCGLNAKQVGDMVGVDQTTISRWESGGSSPTYQQLAKLCEIYQISPDDIRFNVPNSSAESGRNDS